MSYESISKIQDDMRDNNNKQASEIYNNFREELLEMIKEFDLARFLL